jgi:hypothetical protein
MAFDAGRIGVMRYGYLALFGEAQQMLKKGKPSRPILVPGLASKKFHSLWPTRKRVKDFLHPMFVAIDLRRGSLDSLNAYLKKHRGIPDREVALELRKLLSGSAARTKFRLMVVDHPDAAPSKGGRLRTKSMVPSPVEVELVEKFRAQLEVIGKIGISREEVANKVSVSTVRRAIRKVEAAEAQEKKREALVGLYELALENLRKRSSGHETS